MNTKTIGTDAPQAASSCGAYLSRPRDRIVATARDLFHRHGIRSVGVEMIAEAAGTNKMTLYRHFSSKDELVVECLQKVADDMSESWHELELEHPDDPMCHLLGWVRAGADCLMKDMRGCDLANAAVEFAETDHPARRLIESCKKSHRDRVVELCKRVGVSQAELLADTLCLLFEGARVSRQSAGAEGPSAKYVRMSEAVITAFVNGER